MSRFIYAVVKEFIPVTFDWLVDWGFKTLDHGSSGSRRFSRIKGAD
jgi:hypothetical protein